MPRNWAQNTQEAPSGDWGAAITLREAPVFSTEVMSNFWSEKPLRCAAKPFKLVRTTLHTEHTSYMRLPGCYWSQMCTFCYYLSILSGFLSLRFLVKCLPQPFCRHRQLNEGLWDQTTLPSVIWIIIYRGWDWMSLPTIKLIYKIRARCHKILFLTSLAWNSFRWFLLEAAVPFGSLITTCWLHVCSS